MILKHPPVLRVTDYSDIEVAKYDELVTCRSGLDEGVEALVECLLVVNTVG